MDSLLKHLFDVKTRQEVLSFLEQIEGVHAIRWRPVGDRENNLATINLGSDPAAGLIERITNAIDAVLEREWLRRGQPTDVRSPREAVASWFNIPEGRLSNIASARDLQELSSRVQVTLHDSEDASRPTVDIRDYGIGLTSEEFPETILSLNASRKLQKLFLAGAFGQGGSTALSYSHFTIILSRKFGGSTQKPVVAGTVVRFNPGDPKVDKHGVYEYLVDQNTGCPFFFSVDDSEFAAGTLVRHVAMDLGKYRAPMTVPTGSLWYLAHHYLFDPVFPFRIEEQRNNKSKGANRFVGGNNRRLSQGSDREYTRSAVRNFREGKVSITWWVLSPEGEKAKDRISNYTLPSKPIVITFNGQKQGELPNTIIKDDLKLPYLERYIVVQVDCDNLDHESRRQLFPTTRESLRDTSLLDDLRQLVVDTLSGDDELKRLDQVRKDRYLCRVEPTSIESLRKRLAKRVEQYMEAGEGSGAGRRSPDNAGNTSREPPTPIPVQDPPTFIEVIDQSPKRVYAGGRFRIRFKTDADPAYFTQEGFSSFITPSTFAKYTGHCSVHQGYGTAYFEASPDLKVGSTAEIVLELRPPRSRTLSTQATVEVAPEPENTGGEGRGSYTANINPIWVGSQDPYWKENGWDTHTVAAVAETSESIDVFVSQENHHLNRLIARAQRRGQEAVETIKSFYLEHIAFHAVLAKLAETRAMHAAHQGGSEIPDPLQAERQRDQEMQRICETICGIIEQVFDHLIAQVPAVG